MEISFYCFELPSVCYFVTTTLERQYRFSYQWGYQLSGELQRWLWIWVIDRGWKNSEALD